jgi:hypothetical protein
MLLNINLYYHRFLRSRMKENKKGTKSSKFPLRSLSVHFGSMKQKNIAESKKIKGNNSLMLHLHEAELFKFQLGLWYEMVCSNLITKILSPNTLIHVSRVAKRHRKTILWCCYGRAAIFFWQWHLMEKKIPGQFIKGFFEKSVSKLPDFED